MRLGDDCGHHCGVKDGQIGHCPCPDCHALTDRRPSIAEPITSEEAARNRAALEREVSAFDRYGKRRD